VILAFLGDQVPVVLVDGLTDLLVGQIENRATPAASVAVLFQ